MDFITAPLSADKLREYAFDEDTVSLNVLVDLSEILASDEESFDKLLATKVTGSPDGLREIDYNVDGAHEGQVVIWVEAIVYFDIL